MSEKVLDETALRAIRALQQPNSEDLVAKIVMMFLQQQPACIQALRQALAERNARRVAELAHALKSSSANIGAVKVAALSRDIETEARSELLDDVELMVVQLESELDAASAELQELLPTQAVANG